MVENGGSTMPGLHNQTAKAAAEKPTLMPTPQPHRRPRAREVSSRFMSPVTSSSTSSSCGDLHLPSCAVKSPLSKPIISTPSEFLSKTQHRRSNSVQRQRHRDSQTDENRPETNFRCPETSIGNQGRSSSIKQRPVAIKLFNETGSREEGQRLNTPIPTCSDRTALSRYKRLPNISAMTDSVAAKFMQSNEMPMSAQTPNLGSKIINRAPSPKAFPVKGNTKITGNKVEGDSKLSQDFSESAAPSEAGGWSTPHPGSFLRNSFGKSEHDRDTLKSLRDLQSSTPEADMLPTASLKSQVERNSSCGVSVSHCTRSLDFPFSSHERSFCHSIKHNEKSASFSFKSSSNSVKAGSICLPPIPPCLKPGVDTKKAKKAADHQDNVHHLRLLHNRHLQWRYANVRAEASMLAQKCQSEKMLYSLGVKISELQDSLQKKRIELGVLRRKKSLSEILEAQLPYLDEWSALEGDYSSSLLETTKSLLNVSSQLPTVDNVKYDVKEVAEALNSALKAMEMTFLQVKSFMPQAERVDCLISELAKVFGGERALVEECGHVLSKTYISQVEECSLRGQLIQLHQRT
ncbi:hypothetical protein Nepgr_001733 [Nepenthes gracilis]|uniref:Uncharacterized protein n=1 Tax=Nepenthes gracilis TaxID=150966 RepID=A0AAD3P4Z2_NEPGR|nr:hypothetical protein Nepgr_001733 [Nepenthes gracilis]